MDWNCTLTEERLSDFLDGTVEPADAAALSAHTAGCHRCAQLISQVSGLVSRMQQIPSLDEPPFLASRIIAITRGTPGREPRETKRLGWLETIWQPRFGVGLVAVATSFLIVFHAMSAAPRTAALSPGNLYHSANRHVHLTYARGVKFVNDLRVVYVIQSRLSSQPQPLAEPASPAQPNSTPGQRPPDSNARPQAQPIPRTGHSASRESELAILFLADGLRNPLHRSTGSFR